MTESRRAPTQFPYGHLTADAGASADPVLVEIVQGSLASVEMEVETAIGRTSRSPMIRDAHDFRAGIHDRLLRKLTGRSYSALVHPVARDFPLEEMREGDVFFHNDVYRSEGGIGHLPDLCVTVPVFADGRVVAFVQAFGHHDDIGGAVPGSMPSHATSVFEEGLMVPPIRLWDAGVPNRAALTIMTRNSRMPESLAADLDAECSACLMGARRLGELFERYGVETVESCFDAILSRTTETYRREILGKIPVGTWVWEDYAEHDGVDEPMLHTQRITLTRTAADDPDGERLVLDFGGTSPQAKGPINHVGDASDGVFLKKWLAPILRNLADTPERMAELDVNEGVVPLIEMRFPPPGTLLTPGLPGAHQRPHLRDPAAARRAGRRDRQGGRRPDAGRPGDDPLHRRLRRGPRGPPLPDARGARRRLRRPLLRRRRGHHPRRPRLAEPADRVHRGAVPVPGRGAVAGDRQRGSGPVPRRPRLREAHPDAQGRPLHVDRGPVDPGLLGRQGRQGRPAVRGHHRPRRAARARGRRAGRRRAGGRRRGDPDPHHRRWRLGRPARARPGAGGARRGLAQGLARRRRWPTTASCSPARSTTTRCRTTTPRPTPSGPAARRRPRCSSTAVPATRGCPAAPRTPTWTSFDRRSRRTWQDRSCGPGGARRSWGVLGRGRTGRVVRTRGGGARLRRRRT